MIKNFASSPAARIALGIAIGQGLVFATLPVITRIYSPSAVGAAGTFLAVSAIVGSVATFRLETRLPASTEEHIGWLTRTATSAAVVVALVTALISCVATSDPLLSLLLGLTVFGLAYSALMLQLSARRDRLGGVAVSKASQGATQVAVQITAGLASAGRLGMQLGIAVGYLVGAAVQHLTLAPRRAAKRTPDGTISGLEKSGHWRAGAVLCVAALLNALAVWAYPVIVNTFFGPDETGQLTVAMRVVAIPTGLVVTAVAPVVLARLGHLVREGRPAGQRIRRYFFALAPIALLAFVFSIAVPTGALETAFGPEWGRTKLYLVALAPASAMQLLVGPLSGALIVFGRHGLQLLWDALRTGSLLGAMIISAALGTSAFTTVLAGSLTSVVWYAVYGALILSGRHEGPSPAANRYDS